MWPRKAFCGTFPRQVTLPDPHLACSPPPHTTQCHSPVTDELQEGNFVQRKWFASVRKLHARAWFAFCANRYRSDGDAYVESEAKFTRTMPGAADWKGHLIAESQHLKFGEQSVQDSQNLPYPEKMLETPVGCGVNETLVLVIDEIAVLACHISLNVPMRC